MKNKHLLKLLYLKCGDNNYYLQYRIINQLAFLSALNPRTSRNHLLAVEIGPDCPKRRHRRIHHAQIDLQTNDTGRDIIF